MIKFLKKQFTAAKRRFLLKKYFEPEKKFLAEAKFSFLSNLREKTKHCDRKEKTAIYSSYSFWQKKPFRYAIPVILIAVVFGAGMIILGDGFGGNFAKRRLEEIKIKKSKNQDIRLVDLDKDLYYGINSAAFEACDPKLSETETNNLCGSLSGLIEKYEKISGDEYEYENFNCLINACETFSNTSNYNSP
jgi:hypothetical protein